MSLAKLKAKESKGKRKTLPKLKTILASPYTEKCRMLNDDEQQELRGLFKNVLPKNQEATRAFATKCNIHLGLESCLRAINNCHMSCVLISRNIKPRHIVSLIARNVAVKDETVPVYVQPNLELFTEELFKVRALAMVLPEKFDSLGVKLEKWVNAHRKQPKSMIVQSPKISFESKTQLKNPKESQKEVKSLEKLKTKQITSKTTKLPKSKTWSGDFISFASSDHNQDLDKLKLDEDKDILLGTLSTIVSKAATEKQIKEQTSPISTEVMEIDEENSAVIDNSNASDSDDFISEYKPLIVHKIRPNPDKKPKKKRKKNKNK